MRYFEKTIIKMVRFCDKIVPFYDISMRSLFKVYFIVHSVHTSYNNQKSLPQLCETVHVTQVSSEVSDTISIFLPEFSQNSARK